MAIPLRASSDPSDSAATCNYLDGGAVDSTAIVPGMDAFTPVVTLHAVAATYVLLLGPLQILRRRRDLAHRIVGLSWLMAMVTVCLSSFWIAPDGFSEEHTSELQSRGHLVCRLLLEKKKYSR